MLTNYEAIDLLFEEHVFVDDEHRKSGYSFVIEHLAERFDALEEKIAYLEDMLAKCEEQRRVSTVDDVSDGMYQKGWR